MLLLQRRLRPPGGGEAHESLGTKQKPNKLEIQLNYNKNLISVAGIPFVHVLWLLCLRGALQRFIEGPDGESS